MNPASHIEVDQAALCHNVQVVREVLSRSDGGNLRLSAANGTGPGICAVLKADGYGLGAARLAKRLVSCGVNMVAVFNPEQAREVVSAGVTAPILILMPIDGLDRTDPLYAPANRGQLHLTVHDRANLATIINIADALGLTLPVHVEVDTGMSRGGVSPKEAERIVSRIHEHPRLKLAGVFTHFASADTDAAFTAEQNDQFDAFLARVRPMLPQDCLIHEANTFAAFRAAAYHRSMVRVGLAMLGYAKEEFGDAASIDSAEHAARLRPVMRWMSRLVHVKTIEAGTPVGYRASWKAPRRTRLGVVPVGYADGYPLALSNKGKVAVELDGGIRAFVPIVGRVSMDQITVDLTDLPANEAVVGKVVEVVGNRPGAPNHLPTIAREAGTITHELLCRLSPRTPRKYLAMEQGQPGAASAAAPSATTLAV